MQKERLDIVTRTIDWNAKRFKREFDYPLEQRLLAEETEELFSAKTDIERMDAVGDISFVAIGTMWKLGIDQEIIKAFFYEVDLAKLDLPHLIGWANECKGYAIDNLPTHIPTAWTGFCLAVDLAFVVGIGQLRGRGLQEYYYDIVEAICDSNDTKAVKKTPTGEKANIDKGLTYKSPDARLFEIYTKAMQRVNGA